MGKTKKGKKEPQVRKKNVADKRVATATTTKAAKSGSSKDEESTVSGVFSSLWLI